MLSPPLVESKHALKDSVNSVDSVRDKSPQRVSSVRFFSQNYTEEQNTQAFTETLSQPISQNLTANFSWNALCSLYAEGLLCARNCAPKSSVNSVCSVRENTPQRVACVSSHRVGAFSFSQIYTEEQNTQRPTETLSQPISQNLTANFSSNVLWILYAEGLLWDRNVRQKRSVKSVSSVREKNILCERKKYPLWEGKSQHPSPNTHHTSNLPIQTPFRVVNKNVKNHYI